MLGVNVGYRRSDPTEPRGFPLSTVRLLCLGDLKGGFGVGEDDPFILVFLLPRDAVKKCFAVCLA